MGKLYTCEEVANRYGVKTLTVWDWIRKGRLSAIKMPKGYRISEEALREYEGRGEGENGR
ncbi:helix-turn-helix domain-containing protein [Oscillibacter ruminantium]|uniref:helix-turn-helix domain-containing protein n=1 Tax=Oscillibacter ruminantium TaxID=1263547 RepID=UPI00332D3CDC